MRKITLDGPYDLEAFEVIPALVKAGIIEQPSEEFILSYRPSIRLNSRVKMTLDVPEKEDLEKKKLTVEESSMPPGEAEEADLPSETLQEQVSKILNDPSEESQNGN